MKEPDELQQMRRQVLTGGLKGLDAASVDGLTNTEFREHFVRSIHHTIETANLDLIRDALIRNPALKAEEKAKLAYVSAVAQAYLATLVELIVFGNAQWTDPTMLPDQFKHAYRRIIGTCAAIPLDEA